MPRLPKVVKQHLEKARSSALCAVEVYNKPGVSFRTRNYVVLMVIAWTSLFHAIFYRRGTKPWYSNEREGRAVRYVKVDGEPKHWELSECLRRFYGDRNPPERENLKFMAGLRNKIEHRSLPQLDPALYGECQAMLMNLEDLLVREFGKEFGLGESLAVALQFSSIRPDEQRRALRRLAASETRSVLDYVEKFRAGLSPEVLASSKYSLSVYLIPKIANRENAADLSVEFIHVDASDPDQLQRLQRWNAFIKEKQIPIASKDLLRPSQVVAQVQEELPYRFTMHTHTQAWKHYGVRPSAGDDHPERTRMEFCVYDSLMGGHGYTEAWVRRLCRKLADPDEFEQVTGKAPKEADEAWLDLQRAKRSPSAEP